MAVRATGAWTSTSTYRVRWAVRAWARHQSGAALRGRLRRLLPVVDAAVRLRAQARSERGSRIVARSASELSRPRPPAGPPLGGWSVGVRGSRSPGHSGSRTATAGRSWLWSFWTGSHAAGGLTLFVPAAAAGPQLPADRAGGPGARSWSSRTRAQSRRYEPHRRSDPLSGLNGSRCCFLLAGDR